MAKKKRDLWVIELTSIDPSRDATVAFQNRKEAIEAAVDFIKDAAKYQLETIGWDPEEEAPQILKETLKYIEEGKLDDAIVAWLDFQSNYDPEERIAIGPSGSVSDSPHDFPVERRG